MGRIGTVYISRMAQKVIDQYPEKFSKDFKKNKHKRKLDTSFSLVPLNRFVSNISKDNKTGNYMNVYF